MKTLTKLALAGLCAATLTLPTAALAQDRSYTPGTVWETSRIDVMPGQFENYMDYLQRNWKRVQEAGKAEGVVVDYHVLASTNARAGEPDLILVVEYKDFQTTAQAEAFQKKVNALLAQDERAADTASAARGKMRESMGSIQYQELELK